MRALARPDPRASLINIKRPKLIIRRVALTARKQAAAVGRRGSARSAMRRRAEQWLCEKQTSLFPGRVSNDRNFSPESGIQFQLRRVVLPVSLCHLIFPLKMRLAEPARADRGYQIFIRILPTCTSYGTTATFLNADNRRTLEP